MIIRGTVVEMPSKIMWMQLGHVPSKAVLRVALHVPSGLIFLVL